MNPVRSMLHDARRRVGRPRPRRIARGLTLRPWPGDPRTAHLVVTDHEIVPTRHELELALAAARCAGYTTVRSSALFPRAATQFRTAGFEVVDTLALLRIVLDDGRADIDRRDPLDHGARLDPAGPAVSPLRTWHHRAAADVDRAAFGEQWGNDAAGLTEIRRATPAHHARRVTAAGTLVGIALSGAAGHTGYLQRLAVRPSYQRRGVGTALVADALRWMRRRGATTAMVNTGVDNRAALELYARFGFEVLDERLEVVERPVGADAARTPAPDAPGTTGP